MVDKESPKPEAKASVAAQEQTSAPPNPSGASVASIVSKYQTPEDKRSLTDVPVDDQWHRVLGPQPPLSKECWDNVHADQRLAYGVYLDLSWIFSNPY